MIDFCSVQGAVVLDNEVDLIIQQIEMLFDTRPGEVLGQYDFGVSFDTYLFNPNIGSHMVENEVTNYITSNVELFGWSVDVKVEFLVGTQHDIMIMQVSFHKNTDVYTKLYKVSEGSIEYM